MAARFRETDGQLNGLARKCAETIENKEVALALSRKDGQADERSEIRRGIRGREEIAVRITISIHWECYHRSKRIVKQIRTSEAWERRGLTVAKHSSPGSLDNFPIADRPSGIVKSAARQLLWGI